MSDNESKEEVESGLTKRQQEQLEERRTRNRRRNAKNAQKKRVATLQKNHNRSTPRKKDRLDKTDNEIMKEFKHKLLKSHRLKTVLDQIMVAALDDEHKNQAVAWKLIMDRVLPSGMFDREFQQSGGKSAIQINITGINASVEETQDDYIDAEVIDSE